MQEHTVYVKQEPKEFDIFFEDLTDEAQKQLLGAFGMTSPEEFNNMPIAVVIGGTDDDTEDSN